MRRKKGYFFAIVLLLIVSLSIPVFACHTGDDFRFGAIPLWATQAQWSHFYCPVQYHHATAIVVDLGGHYHIAKRFASAGHTAKACTGFYAASQWNSYYGHD